MPEPDAGRSGAEPRRTRLDERTTAAIREAFFAELAAVGYGRLSVDSVVRQAGVSKAAVYRRWRNKREMTEAFIAQLATRILPWPDTGGLRGDLLGFLVETHAAIRGPLAARIIPALLSEATRDEALATTLRAVVEEPRRDDAQQLLERAIARGELPVDLDLDLCLDHMIGVLYFHALVRQRDLTAAQLERLADSIIAAVRSSRVST